MIGIRYNKKNTKYLITYVKKKTVVQCLGEVILYDGILLHCQPLCLMLVLSEDQLLGCTGFASTQDYPMYISNTGRTLGCGTQQESL